MELQHDIASDALEPFRKAGDEKAVAIACNNVCNISLALSIDNQAAGGCIGVDGACLVKTAIQHYDEAINSGTREFYESDSDALKAEFAQQLADRHFNRAMFLLHTIDDPFSPENTRELAFTDLFRCREYDRGVRDFFLRDKLMLKYSDVCFDRLMRRIHGLATLLKIDDSVCQVWNPMDLIDEADLMLQAAFDHLDASLFQKIKKVGRLQQLESAAIHVEMNSGNVEEAGRHAVRMFIEDEYIVASAFQLAGKSLLRLMGEGGRGLEWGPETIANTRHELRKMQKSEKKKRFGLDNGMSIVFCIDISDKRLTVGAIERINAGCLAIYDERCHSRDFVGVVASNNSGSNTIVQLGQKDEEGETQRTAIDEASQQITGFNTCSALPTAVDMAIHASSAAVNDVLLFYVGDGSKDDSQSFSVMRKKIEEANNPRNSSIDVIALGLEAKKYIVADCKSLCLATQSRHSGFLDASGGLIDSAFQRAASMISSRMATDHAQIRLGITMEKF
jgi:hypothetical protein